MRGTKCQHTINNKTKLNRKTFSVETQVGASFGGKESAASPSRAGKQTFPFWHPNNLFCWCFLHHFCCQSGCWTWTTVHQYVVDFLPYLSTFTSHLSAPHLVFFLLFFLLFLLRGVRMPGQTLLIERDNHLWAFDVSLLGWDEIGFIRVLPVKMNSKCLFFFLIGQWFFCWVNARNFNCEMTGSCLVCLSRVQFWVLETHHFMRNISSPLESVAPIILSGCKPLPKPLAFSPWRQEAQDETTWLKHLLLKPWKLLQTNKSAWPINVPNQQRRRLFCLPGTVDQRYFYIFNNYEHFQ